MTIKEAIEKYDVGTELFVVKELLIRWNSMRFENTNIISAKYVITESDDASLWGTNKMNILKVIELPEGTKNYPDHLHSFSKDYHCFASTTDAEVWKILELQELENKVNDHIDILKEKTKKKIKSIKQKEKFDTYITKYPEIFLRLV